MVERESEPEVHGEEGVLAILSPQLGEFADTYREMETPKFVIDLAKAIMEHTYTPHKSREDMEDSATRLAWSCFGQLSIAVLNAEGRNHKEW